VGAGIASGSTTDRNEKGRFMQASTKVTGSCLCGSVQLKPMDRRAV
jgi:hypothetical protein